MHDAALLVIDMQRDFCEPGGYAARAGVDVASLAAPIPNIARLIAAFRAAERPVIYTREGHRPDLSDLPPTKRRRAAGTGAEIGSAGPMGRLLVRGEHGHDIVDALRPERGEVVIDKPGYSAFHATDLDHVLRSRGIGTVVLSGITTEVCVHSTLRSAVDRGYACITVADATACDDPEIQSLVMRVIAREGDIFGAVTGTAALVHRLAGERAQPASRAA